MLYLVWVETNYAEYRVQVFTECGSPAAVQRAEVAVRDHIKGRDTERFLKGHSYVLGVRSLRPGDTYNATRITTILRSTEKVPSM